jgi:DNA-binding winged helix-turn-helix (wHTH) protein
LERDLEHASSPDAHRLRIAGDGAWFALASVRQNLRTRQALKRLLLSLAGAHSAGRKLSVDELFEAGWPGERVRRESAARRVYVAIATLRKLGLRDHIERHSEGYALVGAVEIEAAGGTFQVVNVGSNIP